MRDWLFQPALAISVAPMGKDVDPLVEGKIVRALRLVVAGGAMNRRQRAAMWCAAARLLADVQALLPLNPTNSTEVSTDEAERCVVVCGQERVGRADSWPLDLAVTEQAAALSTAMQGNGVVVASELARLVNDLSVSLLLALRAGFPGRRAIVVAGRV